MRLSIQLGEMKGTKLYIYEGLMYGILFLLLVALIFGIITTINLLVFKNDRKFYGWLIFAIFLPMVILFAII